MPNGSHKMPSWVRHMCWNFCGPCFAQSSKLPGKVSIIISGVGAKGHLAGEALGLGPMPRAQLSHAAASLAVAVTFVSPQSMAQNPWTIVLQSLKKRRSMQKKAKVNLDLGVHGHQRGVNSHPQGPGGACPSAGGKLAPLGTWGCTPISGRRTLTLRPQMASDVASGGKDSEKSFCFH